MPEQQPIQARHGTATFVPKGSVIKIINTHGTQVIDTWAFALPTPPKSLVDKAEKQARALLDKDATSTEKQASKGAEKEDVKNDAPAKDEKNEDRKEEVKEEPKKTETTKKETQTPKKTKGKKDDMGLPSQEEAEQLTSQLPQGGADAADGQAKQQTKGWSSYLPSLRGGKKSIEDVKKSADDGRKETTSAEDGAKEKEQKENTRRWASLIPSGQGFSSYLPSKETISAVVASHHRDPNKSYAEQLADFSKTPVGAASLSGMSYYVANRGRASSPSSTRLTKLAITGSGTASALYAGYSAWNAEQAQKPQMEYLSMPHTRAATCHLIPKEGDVLVSNLREPMLTLLEDGSPGVHDTLIAACDPQRYKGLGVENWEEHGSCAENLVLALKELNDRAGLKGAKGVGADVTVNAVPAPLNLFMNIPWTDDGALEFAEPSKKAKEGDFVRLRAERDVVVVMSACPQDVLAINAKEPKDGHFIVEDDEGVDEVQQATATGKPSASAAKEDAKKSDKPKGTPRKLNAAPRKDSASTAASKEGENGEAKKTSSASVPAPKKPAATSSPSPSSSAAAAAPAPAAPAAAKKASNDASEAKSNGSGTATPPTEKKKPRKLERKPKTAGSAAPAAAPKPAAPAQKTDAAKPDASKGDAAKTDAS